MTMNGIEEFGFRVRAIEVLTADERQPVCILRNWLDWTVVDGVLLEGDGILDGTA